MEILSGKYDLEGELKRVCEEKIIEVVHTMNLSRQYENAQATVSEMESYQIKLQSRIDDITSDFVVSRESDNKITTNWTTTSTVKFYMEIMYKH